MLISTYIQCSHHFLSLPSGQEAQLSPLDQGSQHFQKGPGDHQDLVGPQHLEDQDYPQYQGGPTQREVSTSVQSFSHYS